MGCASAREYTPSPSTLSRVFERFLARYPVGPGTPGPLWDRGELAEVAGYREIAARVAGLPLGGGVFRIVAADEGAAASSFVRDGFPEFVGRCVPFAVDWLGRVFAIDRARSPRLLLIEPGTGEAFEIDQPLAHFLEFDLVDDPELLEVGFYDAWIAAGGTAPTAGGCVGFKVPLFLGGAGSVDNLELSDIEVYWGFSSQLRIQTRDLPPGTRIGGVTAD